MTNDNHNKQLGSRNDCCIHVMLYMMSGNIVQFICETFTHNSFAGHLKSYSATNVHPVDTSFGEGAPLYVNLERVEAVVIGKYNGGEE